MRTLSFWDYGLICESLIFIVFIVFVALEFCSTSYAMYRMDKTNYLL